MTHSVKLPAWDFRRGMATARVMTQVGCERGAPLEVLLHQTGIAPEQLEDPHAEIDAAQEIQLIRNLLHVLGNPADLGVEVGKRYKLTTYGLWGFALLSSPTLGEAMNLGLRMLNQTFSLTRHTMQQVGDQVHVVYFDEHLPPDVRRFVMDRDRAMGPTIQREVLGRPVAYTAVDMRQPEPDAAQVERLTEMFGVRPSFGANLNRSIFPAALMNECLPQADPHTARLCEDMCRELVETRNSRRTGVAAKVRDRLLRTPGHIPDMEQIAAEMHMTSRTLRRHLTAEGATFRGLLEEVRSTLAVELMTRARLTHGEIAERLGYADVTTFIEAFRRWKGMPPSEYRRQQGLRPSHGRLNRPMLRV